MYEKILSRQAILLITICRIVTILTVMPTIYIEPANQDTWIMIAVSFIYTMISSIPIIYISKKFKNLDYLKCMEKIFGSFIGKIIGVIYVIFYLTIAITFSYIGTQMIRTSLLPNMKPIITLTIALFTHIYISSKGTMAIMRYTEIFVPIILSAISIFIILGLNNVDFSVFLPIYKNSTFLSINFGAIKLDYLFLDIHLLVMISPKLKNQDEISGIFTKAVLYSLIIVLAAVVVTQGSFGIEQAKHSNFPFLNYIRLVNINDLIQRLESFYILIWIFAMIIKITAYIHIADQGLKGMFKEKFKNQYLGIIGIICAVAIFYLAEVSPQFSVITEFTTMQFLYYFIHKSLIPIIAVIVYFIRRKTLESKENL